jgi:alpha-N-acetylglucosaminidase
VTVAPATAMAAFDVTPARNVVQRLLPAHSAQITLVDLTTPTGRDEYRISGTAGAVRVEGTSPATLLAGVGTYLKKVARIDIGVVGNSLSRLPTTLPAVASTIVRPALVGHRFALNDTEDGYAGAYRTFAELQRLVDVLALNGYNEVFVQVGAEYPYYAAMQQFGYAPADMLAWIPAPLHQPWFLLQNISGFGGPISQQLLTARANTGAQLTSYLRSLGMRPVLPGYFGTVPADFASRNAGAVVVPQGNWVGFPRPGWLAPTNTFFPRVAAAFYAAQKAKFGTNSMFKMDLLHEGGNPGTVNLTAAAGAVQTAMSTAYPGSTWVMLGWLSNPRSDVLAGVDKTRTLIVDGISDRAARNRESDWGNTPYTFGSIPNFGGNSTIGANTTAWLSRFTQWRTKTGSRLAGIAYMPESSLADPVLLELFGDLAWEPDLNQSDWFSSYAARRYGGADTNAAAAWDHLRRGPYSPPPSDTLSQSQDSLFSARPSLTATTASVYNPTSMRYDPATTRSALNSLLKVPTALRATDAYRYDIVDVARQVLANRSRELLPQIKIAYDTRNLSSFRSLTTQWNTEMALLDRVTGADARFMIGPWIAAARAAEVTTAGKNQLEYDARSIVTTWGPRAAATAGLHDYASREWSGLISGLYAPRWAQYFATLDTALANNTTPASVDWFAMEDAWAKSSNIYPTTPSGDAFTLAQQVAALPPISSGSARGPIIGIDGKCVDVTGGNPADGTALQLYTCVDVAAQTWTAVADGTLRAMGKCMDARNGATASGTPVQLYTCNGTINQVWTPQANGTLRHSKSGLCLDAFGASSADGTALILWTCKADVNQIWLLPGS